jgi:hypothetical protein
MMFLSSTLAKTFLFAAQEHDAVFARFRHPCQGKATCGRGFHQEENARPICRELPRHRAKLLAWEIYFPVRRTLAFPGLSTHP